MPQHKCRVMAQKHPDHVMTAPLEFTAEQRTNFPARLSSPPDKKTQTAAQTSTRHSNESEAPKKTDDESGREETGCATLPLIKHLKPMTESTARLIRTQHWHPPNTTETRVIPNRTLSRTSEQQSPRRKSSRNPAPRSYRRTGYCVRWYRTNAWHAPAVTVGFASSAAISEPTAIVFFRLSRLARHWTRYGRSGPKKGSGRSEDGWRSNVKNE